jgi:hypothetical protein
MRVILEHSFQANRVRELTLARFDHSDRQSVPTHASKSTETFPNQSSGRWTASQKEEPR